MTLPAARTGRVAGRRESREKRCRCADAEPGGLHDVHEQPAALRRRVASPTLRLASPAGDIASRRAPRAIESARVRVQERDSRAECRQPAGSTTSPRSSSPNPGLCATSQVWPSRSRKTPAYPPVERLRRLARHLGAHVPGQRDHLGDRLARADIVCEGDAAPACAVIVDARLGRELVAAPEHEDRAVGLEERCLLDVYRNSPSQALVERLGARVVGHAERHEADSLLHPGKSTDAREGQPRSGAGRFQPPSGAGRFRMRTCDAEMMTSPLASVGSTVSTR